MPMTKFLPKSHAILFSLLSIRVAPHKLSLRGSSASIRNAISGERFPGMSTRIFFQRNSFVQTTFGTPTLILAMHLRTTGTQVILSLGLAAKLKVRLSRRKTMKNFLYATNLVSLLVHALTFSAARKANLRLRQ